MQADVPATCSEAERWRIDRWEPPNTIQDVVRIESGKAIEASLCIAGCAHQLVPADLPQAPDLPAVDFDGRITRDELLFANVLRRTSLALAPVKKGVSERAHPCGVVVTSVVVSAAVHLIVVV